MRVLGVSLGFLSGLLVFECMHAYLSGCTVEVDVKFVFEPACFHLHVSVHHLHYLQIYNVFFSHPQCTVISKTGFCFSSCVARDTLRLQSGLPSSCINFFWGSISS